MTQESRHLSIRIERPPDVVYRFASDARNLPQWAAGLAGSIQKEGDHWLAASPMGRIRVEFTPPNPFRVLDHVVVLPSGERIENPLRVVPNGDGCEVVFSLVRRRGVSDGEFEEDAQAVLRDLRSLKALMEAPLNPRGSVPPSAPGRRRGPS